MMVEVGELGGVLKLRRFILTVLLAVASCLVVVGVISERRPSGYSVNGIAIGMSRADLEKRIGPVADSSFVAFCGQCEKQTLMLETLPGSCEEHGRDSLVVVGLEEVVVLVHGFPLEQEGVPILKKGVPNPWAENGKYEGELKPDGSHQFVYRVGSGEGLNVVVGTDGVSTHAVLWTAHTELDPFGYVDQLTEP